MGIFYSTDNDKNYYKYNKVICEKCNDKFFVSYGGYSQRKSCREHNYINNICTMCNKKMNEGGSNCYHKKKKTCWN